MTLVAFTSVFLFGANIDAHISTLSQSGEYREDCMAKNSNPGN